MKALLDTCVISELVSKKPSPKVIEFVDSLDSEDVFLSVITIGEIVKGIEKLPSSPSSLNRIVVRKGNAINLIPVTELRYVEAQDDYVMIHHSAGKALKQQTMKFYEDNLPGIDFVRIHRSYIVRVSEIKRIEPYGKDNHVAILHSGDKLPVSRAGYKHLKEELNF